MQAITFNQSVAPYNIIYCYEKVDFLFKKLKLPVCETDGVTGVKWRFHLLPNEYRPN